jgi:hypothetical protein
MTKADAQAELNRLIKAGNGPEARTPDVTLEEFIKTVYIPNRKAFWRPKWKANLQSFVSLPFL